MKKHTGALIKQTGKFTDYVARQSV